MALLLAASLPAPAHAATALPPLGMDTAAVRDLQTAGAAPRYASFWVGPWMATSGWGGLDNALQTAKATGTTPVLYWYYWGDSISSSCVEYGCNGRSRAQWTSMTSTLATHVRDQMGGAEVLIVLENEFNKNGITGTYAPTFDGYLEGVAKTLKGVAGVKLILGFGAWGESQWTQFPRSAAQSEYVGFQMMRGSTRHTEAQYRDAASQVAYYTSFIAQKFNKPSFLYDLALSSYPDANWEKIQGETLSGVFDSLVSSGTTGLQGVIYRSLKDHYMDPSNYFGAAESYWGLKRSDGSAKPAWNVWYARATASGGTTTTTTPNVPGSFEAEALTASAGGRQSDATASGGAVWNLWSNGEVRAPLRTDAAYAARVTVVARGDLAGGVAPHMDLRLGGATFASFDVPAGYASYSADVTLPAGASQVTVVFTNDAVVNGQDRNLVVDVVKVGPVPVNRAPVASIGATGAYLSWSFDARGSTDADGDALTYAWSFGDGATATGPTAAHTYAAAGTYTVTLTASDGKASDGATYAVTATRANAAPNAAFTVGGAGLSWSFDATSSTDADGDALTYAWTFGDGASATGAKATHAYAAPGSYPVKLTVSDGKASDAASATVTATQPNRAPTASFTVSGQDATWSFDGTASTDPDGNALTYAWSFGDGATATGPTATHTYAAAGAYTVRLTVSDGSLGGATSRAVTATIPPFAATFSGAKGNDWWVQVDVAANKDLNGVCASVNGGTCRALAKQSWGSWAASFYVAPGSDVAFRAMATSGETMDSIAYDWPSGNPALRATFTPYDGSNWWVQVRVDANLALRSVCVSVNGGACQALTYRTWGAWAESIHTQKNAKVVFTATSTDGQVVRSATYIWPVA